MYAALNGNHQIISLLLEKGAEINVKTKDNWTALARAKQGQHWKIYQTLARAGGRP
jgi:ankyrin repeat protein